MTETATKPQTIGYSGGIVWDEETGADLTTRHCETSTAKLFAASPDLLESLRGLVGRVDSMAKALNRKGLNSWPREWLGDELLDDARVAIARATGEGDHVD